MKRVHDNNSSSSLPALPQLAPGWCWATLGALASPELNSITDGPFGSKLKTEHYTSNGPRVVRLQNIGDGIFRHADAHISEDHFQTLQKHRVFAGDLVVAALGEVLPRACLIPDSFCPAIVKADCIKVKPDERLAIPSYLCFALNSQQVRKRTSIIIHGVGRPRLNLMEIKSIDIPIAPIEEQKRIVAKIEELFSDLDAGVAALQRVRANLKRYRASVLKAAVEGKLTEAWRAEQRDLEPASELLRRILTERRRRWEADQRAKHAAAGKPPPANWQAKYAEPSPPDTTDLPELPKRWCYARVGQLIRHSQNGFGKRRQGHGTPTIVLRLADIYDGRVSLSNPRRVNATAEEIGKFSLMPGDLLAIRVNGSPQIVGRFVRFQEAAESVMFCDHFIQLRFVIPELSAFFRHVGDTRRVRHYVEEHKVSSAGQNTINQATLEKLMIPLPPLAEQAQIVAEVEERLSILSATERAIEASLKRAARLRQSILKRAFAGQLVPQDPCDEPASVLLERIRQRRATLNGADQVVAKRKPKRKPVNES